MKCDIRGVLWNAIQGETATLDAFMSSDGRPVERREVFETLCDALAAGHRTFPPESEEESEAT